MARIVVLDTEPLWLITSARGKPLADASRAWARALVAVGVRVLVPEIADYEVRRELILRGAIAGIARLDAIASTPDFLPITTLTMRKAAEFWAAVRRGGQPTAAPGELDGDAILAAHAVLAGRPVDSVVC